MRNIVGWRLYILSLVGAAALLFTVRIFVIPRYDPSVSPSIGASLSQITDSLIGVSVGSIILSLLISTLIRKEIPSAEETELLPPKNISSELRTNAAGANRWCYRGHTGRYFRTAILPLLKEGASSHGRYIDVQVQVLDPDDLDVIRFFAEYRAEVNPARAGFWSTDRARAEIGATVLSLWAASRATSRLRCEIFLTRTVSPFTVDLSGGAAVMTRESAAYNALKYPAGSTFYDSMCEELDLSARQARELRLGSLACGRIESEDDVRAALDQLGILSDGRSVVVPMILDAVKNPVNPYAS